MTVRTTSGSASAVGSTDKSKKTVDQKQALKRVRGEEHVLLAIPYPSNTIILQQQEILQSACSNLRIPRDPSTHFQPAVRNLLIL